MLNAPRHWNNWSSDTHVTVTSIDQGHQMIHPGQLGALGGMPTGTQCEIEPMLVQTGSTPLGTVPRSTPAQPQDLAIRVGGDGRSASILGLQLEPGARIARGACLTDPHHEQAHAPRGRARAGPAAGH